MKAMDAKNGYKLATVLVTKRISCCPKRGQSPP